MCPLCTSHLIPLPQTSPVLEIHFLFLYKPAFESHILFSLLVLHFWLRVSVCYVHFSHSPHSPAYFVSHIQPGPFQMTIAVLSHTSTINAFSFTIPWRSYILFSFIRQLKMIYLLYIYNFPSEKCF